ncbi:MAG TPA: DUF3616 domain-containing protein [Methylomirabilota bacterium]|nr:DUF3616 domain-containing protein [Methylomirabilota bacterium]
MILVAVALSELQAAPSPEGTTNTIIFTGCCDASAAALLDEEHIAVADDEDSRLHIYPLRGGPPERIIDLAPFLKLDPKKPEIDLEGAARLGDRIYWISSHGRNRQGEARPSRMRFFATAVTNLGNGVTLRPVGSFSATLLGELIRDPRLREFRLDLAARLAPKFPGGLNIEGLAPTPAGHLLIGFRNPLPRRRALIVPLLNPEEIISARPARLGDPILLNLDELGIRSLEPWQGRQLIVAGRYDTRPEFKLFQWSGVGDAVEQITGVRFEGLNPEALVVTGDSRRLLVLSDDGTLRHRGAECKKLKDASQRRFRGTWIEP